MAHRADVGMRVAAIGRVFGEVSGSDAAAVDGGAGFAGVVAEVTGWAWWVVVAMAAVLAVMPARPSVSAAVSSKSRLMGWSP